MEETTSERESQIVVQVLGSSDDLSVQVTYEKEC